MYILINNDGTVVNYGSSYIYEGAMIKMNNIYYSDSMNVVEVEDSELPENFEPLYFSYIDENVVQTSYKTITRNEFNDRLYAVRESLVTELLIAAKSDVNIETFKFYLEGCLNGVYLGDPKMNKGLDYLVSIGMITTEEKEQILL